MLIMLRKFFIILAVAGFIFDSKKRLLIVKKDEQEKIDGGLWTVPGGKVEPNEHIINALKREVKEEVNLDIENYKWINEDVFLSDNKYFHGQHFLCSIKTIRPLRLDKKLVKHAWIKKHQIEKFYYHPNIKREIIYLFENI